MRTAKVWPIQITRSGTIIDGTYPVITHSHQIFAVMRRVPGCFRFFAYFFVSILNV
ncbi:unnamed protein product [Callosobruchus maculatus]|uniref:Uncharacterized protein n=1 Tax=Callosobruchus maculatus TaxID=64391 RepID=A0A653CHS3_CALMS|nr:unnamed protein product [Callosobruchus maculatus]